jgi:hypothetical protein
MYRPTVRTKASTTSSMMLKQRERERERQQRRVRAAVKYESFDRDQKQRWE